MSELTADRLREMLDYDENTGAFTWLKCSCRRVRPGAKAGRIDRRGYVGINIHGRKYAAHRLAWLYVHGEWPKQHIDHINRNPSDNRIANLRDVSTSANCRNRKQTPDRGISFHKRAGKWQVQLCPVLQPPQYVGLFNSVEEARAAYAAAASVFL